MITFVRSIKHAMITFVRSINHAMITFVRSLLTQYGEAILVYCLVISLLKASETSMVISIMTMRWHENLPPGHNALLFSNGIFYMPSRTDTAGHTKAFIYPVMDHWGGGPRQILTADLSVHSRACQPPDHDNSKSGGSIIPWGPQRGGGFPLGGIVCANSPATCRPPPGGHTIRRMLPRWPLLTTTSKLLRPSDPGNRPRRLPLIWYVLDIFGRVLVGEQHCWSAGSLKRQWRTSINAR